MQVLKPGDVVRFRLDKDGQPQLVQLPQAQAALVSLEAETGALRALVGGFSFSQNKFNRATQAQRQPGSSFKPFVYSAAFERGYTPATIVMDAPVVFRDRAGNVWRPQNDKEDFAGPMRLREAMVQSRNLVSVRLLDAIGVQFAQRYITQFGFAPLAAQPVDVARHLVADGDVGGARLRHLRQWRLPRGTLVHRPRRGPTRRGGHGAPPGPRLPDLRRGGGGRRGAAHRGRRLQLWRGGATGR